MVASALPRRAVAPLDEASPLALEARLTAVVGRLVASRAWERLEFARLGDHAVERVGLSGREVADLARTDAALLGLPRIEAALRALEIAWTKARLLARVPRADDEARWLAFAKGLSARALAREVRAVDRGSLEVGGLDAEDERADSTPRVTVEVRCTPEVRARWWRVREIASRVAGERLPA